jgi:hypothetical protein
LTNENPKIADVGNDGSWTPAPLRGVSLLYVPPGRSTVARGQSPLLHCDLEDPRHALYAGLARVQHSLHELLQDLRPCWLDPHSFHSTYADSVSELNVDQLRPGVDGEIRRCLLDLPASLGRTLPAGFPPARIELNRSWRLRLCFDALETWPDALALVARLKPADRESEITLTELERVRHTTNAGLVDRGLIAANGRVPHVTLGYFVTEAQARDASVRAATPEIAARVNEALSGLTIEHGSIGLYGWTSMQEFWPHRLFADWTNTEGHAAQSALVKNALADPDHSLARLLHLMEAHGQGALYLSGSRLDNDFCLGSDELGALLSVLPADRDKAGVPGYHPGSTEIYTTFRGQLTMACLDADRRSVRGRVSTRNEVVVLPAGQCHRVRDAATTHAASFIVKTNLAHRPGVVRCDACAYFADPADCALHNEWRAETGRGH